jgi:short subunit dehydrogenase-like uncharacterized protein
MLAACVASGTHYLDINGESHLLDRLFGLDAEAREAGIALIPACGYDAVPMECLSCYVADQVPGATWLEVAHAAEGARTPSAGTAGGGVELLGAVGGVLVRRDGILHPHRLGVGGKLIQFSNNAYYAIPTASADLVTGYHATGIPNITAYMEMNARSAQLIRLVFPLLRVLLKSQIIRSGLRKLVAAAMSGPSEQVREETRSYIWACARDESGNRAEAWLDTLEPYKFTAVAAVSAVERVLAGDLRGALTPAQAFGADFVLDVPSTRRCDTLPA